MCHAVWLCIAVSAVRNGKGAPWLCVRCTCFTPVRPIQHTLHGRTQARDLRFPKTKRFVQETARTTFTHMSATNQNKCCIWTQARGTSSTCHCEQSPGYAALAARLHPNAKLPAAIRDNKFGSWQRIFHLRQRHIVSNKS